MLPPGGGMEINMTSENNQNRTPLRDKKKSFFNFPLAFALSLVAGVLAVVILLIMLFRTDIKPTTAAILCASLLVLFDGVIVMVLFFTARTATRNELILHRFSKMLDGMAN